MSNLDASFSALADPTRRAILARLALGEATVMELAEPFEMTQPAISRHLKVLEGAGLILRRVEGTKRPCRLAPAAVARQSPLWEPSLAGRAMRLRPRGGRKSRVERRRFDAKMHTQLRPNNDHTGPSNGG